MSRVDVRCKVELPVSVIHGNGDQKAKEKSASFSILSLNGAYINYKHAAPNRKVVGLRYSLPKHGEFEMLGEVIRKDKKGIAVKFHNVNRDTRIKLWDYIKDNIVESTICPYCSSDNTKRVTNCGVCSWNLNFDGSDYLATHEKESFINRIKSRGKSFSVEDIFKILNFIDVEILGIGKSLEINEEFVGSSRPMLDVFSMIRKVASKDLSVLISGERGTGKELTARSIHERSSVAEGPFIPVNCSSISQEQLETELFGVKKDTLKGTNKSKHGKLEEADGGTIFLDEIGELSMDLQARLLRFMEDKTVDGIGKKVDVRIIAATSRNLKPMIADGRFNKDFFHRIDESRINLVPVRERGEDKLILARYFLNKFSREMNVSKTFAGDAIDSIRNYEWPGNVREIINKVRMSVIMSPETEVAKEHLDLNFPVSDIGSILSLRDVRSTIERQKLIEALNLCKNNISKTSKVLGISRPSVYSLKKKYGI